MSKKIAFHSYQLGQRGTEVAMYKYAKYNQEILGNESVIVSTNTRPTPSLEMFQKEFPVVLYDNVWQNDGKNDDLRNMLESICIDEKVDAFYAIKGGENDGIMPDHITKTLAHAVFRTDQPHGKVYAGICDYICQKYGSSAPYVYHIIEPEAPELTDDLRYQLGIPQYALVLGRHGGNDTFSLEFVKDAIRRTLDLRSDIYFLFLNTDRFIHHERVIHLPYTSSFIDKARFVNTCDGMLHARFDGEIFSVAIPEFSTRNKPIITWKPDQIPGHYDTGHIHVLKDSAIYYKNREDLTNILCGITKNYIRSKDWDVYKDTYSPKAVMQQFDEVFLK
jgi:hypothetical protein